MKSLIFCFSKSFLILFIRTLIWKSLIRRSEFHNPRTLITFEKFLEIRTPTSLISNNSCKMTYEELKNLQNLHWANETFV